MSEECTILKEDLLLILKRLQAYSDLCHYYDECSDKVWSGDVKTKLESIEFMEIEAPPVNPIETEEDFWKHIEEINGSVNRHIVMMNRLYRAVGKNYMDRI